MKPFPEWTAMMLKLAGIANAFWGLTFTLFPDTLFRWAGMLDPQYLFPWKVTGAIALVFGVGYFIAAFNPGRHIMVIVMGFLIKLLELIFMLSYWKDEIFPLKLVLYFVIKDFVWLLPFAIVMYLVFRAKRASPENLPSSNVPLTDILASFHTASGKSLKQLSDERPVLLIFLKHFAFTLWRKAMAEIQNKRVAIENEGVTIVLVHMGSTEEAQRYFNQYNIQGVEHVSDPECTSYNAFNLKKRYLFNLKSWKHGLESDVLRQYSLSKLISGSFRISGAFLIYKGELLKSYRHENVSDQPDYVALASHEII